MDIKKIIDHWKSETSLNEEDLDEDTISPSTKKEPSEFCLSDNESTTKES